jgi:trimethylamine--corrinoid protein Co-methyltransferase
MDFVMSFGLAGDRPAELQDVAHFAAMLRNTAKPLVLTQFEGEAALGRIYEIALAVAGGGAALRRSPFFAIYGQFVSPLQHDENALARLLFCADKEIPIIYIPTIMAGATGPVTMAGALALGNAEALAGLVIHQLRRAGAPFIYGGCVCPFDMRVGGIAYGAPEWHMAGVVLAQLARRYRLPVFSTAGCTDSKMIDEQAIVEGTYSLLLAALSGANLIHDVGYLESGLMGSLVYLTLMDEATAMAKRTLRNFTLDSTTLAVELVDKVGPGGHFLEEEHTLRHFREETWYPRLLDRQKFEGWQERGATSMQARALERVREILRGHRATALPAEAEKIMARLGV